MPGCCPADGSDTTKRRAPSGGRRSIVSDVITTITPAVRAGSSLPAGEPPTCPKERSAAVANGQQRSLIEVPELRHRRTPRSPSVLPKLAVVLPLGPRWVRAATVAHGHQRSRMVAHGSEKPQVADPSAQAAGLTQTGGSDCGPEGRGFDSLTLRYGAGVDCGEFKEPSGGEDAPAAQRPQRWRAWPPPCGVPAGPAAEIVCAHRGCCALGARCGGEPPCSRPLSADVAVGPAGC